jgi:hypothetical protein
VAPILEKARSIIGAGFFVAVKIDKVGKVSIVLGIYPVAGILFLTNAR